jgi:hypothetical protein
MLPWCLFGVALGAVAGWTARGRVGDGLPGDDGATLVRNADDAAGLCRGEGRVRGDLLIEETSWTGALALPCLREVGGTLRIRGNSGLEATELSGLREVGGRLRSVGGAVRIDADGAAPPEVERLRRSLPAVPGARSAR